MHIVTNEAVRGLAQQKGEALLSIYLPTHRRPSSPHMSEDQTRYKNLIQQARYQLAEYDKKFADKTYEQLYARLDDVDFWQEILEGLAVFVVNDTVEFYTFPVECEERVNVSDMFDLTPLHVLLSYNQPFYILVLAEHEPRLYKGDMYGLWPVEVDFPANARRALHIDEMRWGSSAIRGVDSAGHSDKAISPHGRSEADRAGHNERLKYFEIIDGLVCETAQAGMPLLLAATDDDAGDYRAHSTYPYLLPGVVFGNHQHTSVQDLHALAWPVVQKEVVEPRNEAKLAEFQELRGVGRASTDEKEIAEAAQNGRVDTIFLPMLEQSADSVSDVPDGEVLRLIFPENYDTVVSIAHMIHTQSGEIIGLAPDIMPEKSSVAAIYRY